AGRRGGPCPGGGPRGAPSPSATAAASWSRSPASGPWRPRSSRRGRVLAVLQVTNTLTRAKEPVRPRTPGGVGMYSCGPTVYRYAHIGNLRSFLLADLVRRALEAGGV